MNKDCYLKGIRLLTQKEYSRPKLLAKLVNAGFEEDDARECINELYNKGLLKEDWYIESKIKTLMRKGYSPSYIQQRLAYEEVDVSLDLITQIFEDYGHTGEDEQINNLISKKGSRYLQNWSHMGHDERQKITAKLVRALVAKGYSPSSGLKAIESYFNTI